MGVSSACGSASRAARAGRLGHELVRLGAGSRVGAAGSIGTLVGAIAQRFCDDSYWVDIVARSLAPGEDPSFGRGTVATVNRFSGDPTAPGNPVLGEIAEPPFHGLRMRLVGTGIGSSGWGPVRH